LEREVLLRTVPVPDEDIAAALAVLSSSDPAGLLPAVTRADVERVATHMNPVRGGLTYLSPHWGRIVHGHAAAKAIYYHELQEIEALVRSGVRDLENLDRASPEFQHAHALATWRESHYWERWAAAEGESIPAGAFLFAHPWRDPRELAAIALELQDSGVEISPPARVELNRARQFYASKGISR
jgi:hypothetical protein